MELLRNHVRSPQVCLVVRLPVHCRTFLGLRKRKLLTLENDLALDVIATVLKRE